MKLNFSKYQGTGNDFILIDNREGKYSTLTRAQIAKICDRRFGIGAQLQPVGDAAGDRDDVLQRPAQLHADDVFRSVHPETIGGKQLLGLPGGGFLSLYSQVPYPCADSDPTKRIAVVNWLDSSLGWLHAAIEKPAGPTWPEAIEAGLVTLVVQ